MEKVYPNFTSYVTCILFFKKTTKKIIDKDVHKLPYTGKT